MATVYGINAAKINNGTGKIEKGHNHKIRVTYDSYEASGLTVGDVIEMGDIPVGAIILDLKIYHDALGASTSLLAGIGPVQGTSIVSTSSAGVISADLIALSGHEVLSGEKLTVNVGAGTVTGTISIICTYSI